MTGRPTLYPPADHQTQWFADAWPGTRMALTAPVVVAHTTEGSGWPPYDGGSKAPTLTYHPGPRAWRQHFPLDMSARALENHAGGVETNTAGAVQLELIGTCVKGGPGFYWPDADDVHLGDVADFLRWFRSVGYPLELRAPGLWLPYPQSYGDTSARMSGAEWLAFSGVCGHQHVPENVHGDPGAFPVKRLLELAGSAPKPPKAPAKPPKTPAKTGGGTVADPVWDHAVQVGTDPAWLKAHGYSRTAYPARDLLVDSSWRVRELQQHVTRLETGMAAIVQVLAAMQKQLPPAPPPSS